MVRTTAKTPDLGRQLMIKTKTCQRLQKEVAYYQQEVRDNQQKLEEMKQQQQSPSAAAGKQYTIFDIKKFQEVLDESHMMIPDSTRRLQDAVKDLQTFVESAAATNNSDDEAVLKGSEWYELAIALIDEIMKTGSNNDATPTDEGNDNDNHEDDVLAQKTDVSNLQDGEAF